MADLKPERRAGAGRWGCTVVTAGLLWVLAACSPADDGGGLTAAQVAAIESPADLVTAVEAEGLTTEAAPPAALRVARDALVFTELVNNRSDAGQRYFEEVLEADADLLAVLVAGGVDGLVAGVHEAAVDLTTLAPEQRVILANQAFIVEGGTFDSDDYFRTLRDASRATGVGNEERWAVLLGVLDAGRETGAPTGSFVTELDDAASSASPRLPVGPTCPTTRQRSASRSKTPSPACWPTPSTPTPRLTSSSLRATNPSTVRRSPTIPSSPC
jgi:hypothetical protein